MYGKIVIKQLIREKIRKKRRNKILENVKRRISLKVPAMATVWYIGSGALARAIGALSVPIYTRLLTPSEYGLFPLYTSWVGVLSVLVTLEITGAAI